MKYISCRYEARGGGGESGKDEVIKETDGGVKR